MASNDWIDKREEEAKEERAKGYFNIKEGHNYFQLLTHFAPLAQVYDRATNKYRAAVEGEDPKKVSVKGVCWVLQDGLIKEAKLPYVVCKKVREIQQDPEWDFKTPFDHMLRLSAKNAGKLEVEYSLTPSPKVTPISEQVLADLKEKPTPEEIVEKIKGGKSEGKPVEYPSEDIDPADIPF